MGAVRRAICGASTVVLATLVVATPAVADRFPTGPLEGGGGFVIQSCGEPGSSAGWVSSTTNAAALSTGIQCPPVAGNGGTSLPDTLTQTGLWVTDHLTDAGGEPDTPEGAHAELTFTANGGTTISRIRMWRLVGKAWDNNWEPYIGFPSQQPFDLCEIPGSSHNCLVGGDDWYPYDEYGTVDRRSYVDMTGLAASGLVIGLRCRINAPNHWCDNGASLTSAEAAIYSVFFTMADPAPPSVGTPAGAGWTSTGWAEGRLPFVLPSSDNSGIFATRVYVDGVLAATTKRPCSFDRPRPCTDEPGTEVWLATDQLADGAHTVKLAAVDAGGNETRVSRPEPLLTDNHPPHAPVGLVSSTGPSNEAGRFDVRWALPVDHGTPIVGARYQLCQGGTCTLPTPTTTPTSLDGVRLSSATATGTLRVWLEDGAGHSDPAHAAELSLARATPAPPGPGPGPGPLPGADTPKPPATVKHKVTVRTRIKRTGTRLRLTGSMTKRASGRLRVRLTAHGARALTRRVTIRRGRFSTTLRLTRALARAARVRLTVTYAGDPDTTAGTARRTLHRPRAHKR